MSQLSFSEITIDTKSHIDKYNPIDYLQNPENVPEHWIDHYNSTPRQIVCVSDGRQKRIYVKENPSNIAEDDADDILYYLDAALSEDWLWDKADVDDETGEPCIKKPSNIDGTPMLLKEGKEYTLKKVGIDWDTDLGLVWLEEIDNDYGYPAFLFEELAPVSAFARRQSFDAWERQLHEQANDED